MTFKLIYICDSHEVGGAENYLVNLCSSPSFNDKRVLIVANPYLLDFFRQKLGDKVDYHILPADFLGSLLFYLRYKPSLFHFNLTHFTSCMWLHLGAVVCNVRCVATLHSLEHQASTRNPIRRIGRLLHRLLFNSFEKIITPSGYLRSQLISDRHVSAKKIKVIHNGVVDHGYTGYIPKNNGDAFTVVIMGRLARDKGHLVLFSALAKIQRQIPNLKCLVIGDGPYKKELMLHVQQNKLTNVVCFMGFRSDIYTLLGRSDVLVVPSVPPTGENFPLTTIEAMSQGVPVIASRIGGIPEQVIDGQTGFLFSPGDSDEIAQLLFMLHQNPAKRLQVGRSGRKYYLAHFSSSVMASETLDLYRDIMSSL